MTVPATARDRRCRRSGTPRLKREEAAQEPIHDAREPIGLPPCGFSSTAASAGDKVRELNAEITVEMAIVSANWR